MTKYYLSILLFLSFLNVSIGQVIEDFSDGDFTSNPVWSGDNTLFTVASNVLQSQSAGAATYYLSTPSTISANAEWEFFVNLEFGTSGANYVDVFLMSDQADLNTTANGYFVRLGGTVDEIALFKIVGGTVSSVIDGPDGLINSSSSNPFMVKVTRDVSNNWNLFYDDQGTSGTGGYVSGGIANDNSVSSAAHFGFLIKQSSAASPVNSHFFDDISVGTIAADVTAPTVSAVTVTSSTTLDVLFDEAVDVTIAQNVNNYSANNSLGNPSIAVVNGGNPALVNLTFSTAFAAGTMNSLTVNNVADLAGNSMTASNHNFLYFVPVNASFGDVIINEVFPDPSPQLGLPAAEYVEVYNNSNIIFDLANWTISDGSSTGTLPSHLLLPGEVVAIADDNFMTDFAIFPNTIFVTTLPGLNNSEDDVILADNTGLIIDSIHYELAWYQDTDKDNGGYSLELINPTLPCSGASNWIASNDQNGGTPGTQNSVYDTTPDADAPSVSSVLVTNPTTIDVCFDERIDTLGFTNSSFTLNNGISIVSITISSNLTCFTLNVSPTLVAGTVYSLTINNVSDCSGNTTNTTTQIILPHTGAVGDLILNEVLFDPVIGGDDFIEVYNNSDKYIDIYGYLLANWDDGSIDNFKKITTHRLVNPGDFIVLTKDSSDIKLNYLHAVVGSFVEMSSLPTYPNDSATVYLTLPDSTISDQFSYTDEMHFALLKEVDGVSLERIDYDRATQEEDNWHSGAENAGWATPGKQNSQYYPGTITDEMFSTSPDIFSPDNDGFEDVLNISYHLEEPGYVGNLTIYDREGRLVRHLVESELLATDGYFTWDGTTNTREKAPIGVYILYFEVFNLDGNVSGVKKTAVLGGRF